MAKRTKIELGILGPGYFYLPENIIFHCPFCNESSDDNDRFRLELSSSEAEGGFKIIGNCKNCGESNIDIV